MYEPVVTKCLSTTTKVQPKFPNFTPIIYHGKDMEDNSCIEEEEVGNNNTPKDRPPLKPPRWFQRHLTWRNSFSGENPLKMRNGTGDFYVDVEHIRVGMKPEEATTAEAEVQTTLLVPYRLRFWPRCNFKLGPSDTSCALKCRCAFMVVSQWLLSQAGLTIILVIWALLGAYAFYVTEGPRELNQTQTLAKIQKDLSQNLAAELYQSDNQVDTWPAMIHKYFEKHELLFLEAVGAGYGEGGGGNIWTYPGCILFSVSLLTTLGFGAPVPRTPLGRGAAVVFALVGIPLHFLLVLNMGNLMAVRLQQAVFRTTSTDVPSLSEHPRWLKWFPLIAVLVYYLLGVALFGFGRGRDPLHSFMFPLDFTASGGVANVPGVVRIFYALYLEVAVTLAAMVVSLVQASAGKGMVDVGLKWGLLTNT